MVDFNGDDFSYHYEAAPSPVVMQPVGWRENHDWPHKVAIQKLDRLLESEERILQEVEHVFASHVLIGFRDQSVAGVEQDAELQVVTLILEEVEEQACMAHYYLGHIIRIRIIFPVYVKLVQVLLMKVLLEVLCSLVKVSSKKKENSCKYSAII